MGDAAERDCVFCKIIRGEAPAKIVREWDDAICFVPLNPVAEGHRLVIPRQHVQTVFSSPDVAAATMRRVSEIYHGVDSLGVGPEAFNVITSAGAAATQTVFHLHFHIVPRKANDGLTLPWTGQAERITGATTPEPPAELGPLQLCENRDERGFRCGRGPTAIQHSPWVLGSHPFVAPSRVTREDGKDG